VHQVGDKKVILWCTVNQSSSVSKFYFIFIWSSKSFGRHTTHHQEPKTALEVSGFAYVEGCWLCSCWTLSGSACVCRPKPVELHINMK